MSLSVYEEFELARHLLTTLPVLDIPVQASIPANTYVISGPSQNKKLQEMLPGILNQLGADNLANLQKLAQQYQGQAAAAAAAVGLPTNSICLLSICSYSSLSVRMELCTDRHCAALQKGGDDEEVPDVADFEEESNVD